MIFFCNLRRPGKIECNLHGRQKSAGCDDCTEMSGPALCMNLLLATNRFRRPPFLMDDPEPVDYQHWKAYIFTMGAHSNDGCNMEGQTIEMNYGVLPNTQRYLIVPVTTVSGKPLTAAAKPSIPHPASATILLAVGLFNVILKRTSRLAAKCSPKGKTQIIVTGLSRSISAVHATSMHISAGCLAPAMVLPATSIRHGI
jgi:hypothetical protein